jgi:DNA-binding transcriptional LysR family regulator
MLYNTLRQYEYIVAVAETKSLTDAAARLHVSQPSLSVAITRVEQRLGKQIFVRRKGTSIEITPYGHKLVEHARNLLKLATTIEQGPEVAPPFVIGCFEDIAPWYLAPALETLKNAFPREIFQGRAGRFSDLASDLAEGRADIVISYDIGFEGKFERHRIKKITPVAFLAADHPLSVKPSVELEELINHPLILSNEDLSEGFMRNLFTAMRLSPTVAQRATSLEMMRSLAAHGIGIGISYSQPPSNTSYDGKPLVTIPITSPQAATEISLLWSSLRETDPQFMEIMNVLA